jgi:hypothetical protein
MTYDRIATRDLQLSAYLIASGIELVDTTRSGSIVTFHFDGSEAAEQCRRAFINGSAVVNMRAYNMAQRSLLALVHERS